MWAEKQGRKRWRETQSLGADQVPDWSERVCDCCGHWPWLPRLPVLLEMPAAVMCCDRG